MIQIDIIIKSLLTVDFKLMKEQNKLEASLNFSDALKKLKNQKNNHVQLPHSNKLSSRHQVSQRYQSPNHLTPKLTKRSNVTLSELLEEFMQDSSNLYILKLSGMEGKRESVKNFDGWISQMSKKDRQNQDTYGFQDALSKISKKVGQNHTMSMKQTQKIQNSGTSSKGKKSYPCSPLLASNRLGIEPFHTNPSSEKYLDFCLLQQPKLSFGRKHSKNIVNFRTQFEGDQDQVVQQMEKLQRQAVANQKQNYLGHQKQKKEQDKQNTNPNQTKPNSQVKGLSFSKTKRYRGSKRKRKAQV